jgi:hypothetical protein
MLGVRGHLILLPKVCISSYNIYLTSDYCMENLRQNRSNANQRTRCNKYERTCQKMYISFFETFLTNVSSFKMA